MYGWHRKFLEGRFEVENTLHICHPRTNLSEGNIGAIQDILEGAAYKCQQLDETKCAYRQKRHEF